jgi:hypothetical protein
MNLPDNHYRCLAVRRVNPFLGVLQVVSTRQARAVSTDGRSWQIQVYAERPTDLWAGQGSTPIKGMFRFGVWTPERGLDRVPVNPILNNASIIPAAEELVGILQTVHHQVPFPQQDRLELWLLDRHRLPLALLATSVSEPERFGERVPKAWAAATRDMAGPLKLPALSLESRIAQEAGASPVHCWFRREDDGAGVPLAPLRGLDRAAPAAFPETLFRDPQPPPAADAYMAWLAPRLLALDGLSDATRGRLERLGRSRALDLAALWRLYPKIIHPELLASARVEAAIRQAS